MSGRSRPVGWVEFLRDPTIARVAPKCWVSQRARPNLQGCHLDARRALSFLQSTETRMSPMKFIVSAAALAFVMIWTAVISTVAMAQERPIANPTAGQASWGPPNPQIDIAYVEPRDPRFRPIYDKLKQRQVLEELQSFLAPLRLPRKLQVKID